MKRQIIWAIAMLSLLTSACQDSPEPSKSSPPMGWNSWDCFGMDVTEDQFKQTADYMAKHLVSTGWEYVVIDMGWDYDEGLNTSNFRMQNPPLCFDEFGRLIPNLRRFPSSARDSGFRELGDYVHNLGLKFGIHIQRGIPWEAVEKNTPVKGTSYRAKDIYTDSMACTWYHGMKTVDMDKPGSQEYYNSLFEQYASWGVDFVKADDMGQNAWEIEAISKAIKHAGRPMVLSLSGGGNLDSVNFLIKNNALMWRITGDIWDDWSFVMEAFNAARKWQDHIGPDNWPDLDMLPLGKLRINSAVGMFTNRIKVKPEETINEFSRLTADEQYTVFTLWSIFRSPLMMGGNLLEMDDNLFQMLTNEEVLYVNQHSSGNHELRADENEIIWIADNPNDGSKYVSLFNISDNDKRKIKVTWEELGIEGKFNVRDLWQKKDIGKFTDSFEMTVNPHGCGFYKVSKSLL